MSGLVTARPVDHRWRRPMRSQATAAGLLCVIGVIQLAWMAALAYGLVRLIT